METLLDSTRYNITTTQYALLPKINIIFNWTPNLFFMQLVKWCIHVFNFFAHLWKRYIIRYSWKWTRGRRCSAKERWSIRCHFHGPYDAYYGKYFLIFLLLCFTLHLHSLLLYVEYSHSVLNRVLFILFFFFIFSINHCFYCKYEPSLCLSFSHHLNSSSLFCFYHCLVLSTILICLSFPCLLPS